MHSIQTPTPADATIANLQYRIVRIYLKGASSEVPNMASVPRQAISPHVGVDMQTTANPAGAGMLECVLRIALHARLEGKTIFLVEVSVAGVFELDIDNMTDAQQFVRKIAPSVLFPFARRDLASLSVAAGFQPVLLDHIDFDSMLEQVITSQRLTRQPTPMPMRLDVIAARKVVAPAAVSGLVVKAAPASTPNPTSATATAEPARDRARNEWHNTQPSVLSSRPEAAEIQVLPEMFSSSTAVTKILPMAGDGNARHARPKRGTRNAAMVALGVATLGASVAWLTQREPATARVVTPQPPTFQPQTFPPAAGVVQAAAPAVQLLKMPIETERAIASSQARLADQRADWFTLDMGTALASAPLSGVLQLPLQLQDRPVFVLTNKGDSLRLLYGVFPTKEAAERVRTQLLQTEAIKAKSEAAITPIGSFL